MLEGGGQYCIWGESFRSLNRLVDFYRAHSIAVEKVVCLRDPPSAPPLPPSQPERNPYPNPYKSISQGSPPSARLGPSHRAPEPVAGVSVASAREITSRELRVAVVVSRLRVVAPSLCRNPGWLTRCATTPPRRPPTSTSCAVTSSTCWTAPTPGPGGGAVEAEWGYFRQNTSSRCTTDDT